MRGIQNPFFLRAGSAPALRKPRSLSADRLMRRLPPRPGVLYDWAAPPETRWWKRLENVRRLAWLALAGQLVILLIVSSGIYHRFELSVDFGAFHHAWHQVAHGEINPVMADQTWHFWQDQFQLILWPLSLLYFVDPHPITLLWVQDIATVLTEMVAVAWVLDIYRQRQAPPGFPAWAAAALTVLLLVANPWIYLANGTDFHFEILSTLFLTLAARDLWRGRLWWSWLWVAATLTTASFAGAYVVGLGLSALVAGRSLRRQGWFIAGAGLAWLGLVSALSAHQGTAPHAYSYLGNATGNDGLGGLLAIAVGIVTHPGKVASVIGDRLDLVYQNLAPVGFLGFVWPGAVGVVLAVLGITILNQDPVFGLPSHHEMAIYIFAAVGTVVVVMWVARRVRVPLLAWVLAAAIVGGVLAFTVQSWPYIPRYYVTAPAASELGRVLPQVRPGDEVIVSVGVAGRFAGRKWVYFCDVSHKRYAIKARTVDFVFTPAEANEALPPPTALADAAKVRDVLGAAVISERAGVYAYRWTPPPGSGWVTLP